jgi:hypothetical protein
MSHRFFIHCCSLNLFILAALSDESRGGDMVRPVWPGIYLMQQTDEITMLSD